MAPDTLVWRPNWDMSGARLCGVPGTLMHIATAECSGLESALLKAVTLWKYFLRTNQILFPIIRDFSLGDPNIFLKFLLDPSTIPEVIYLQQLYPAETIIDKLCYMTRTWLYVIHKERLKLLGLWFQN